MIDFAIIPRKKYRRGFFSIMYISSLTDFSATIEVFPN